MLLIFTNHNTQIIKLNFCKNTLNLTRLKELKASNYFLSIKSMLIIKSFTNYKKTLQLRKSSESLQKSNQSQLLQQITRNKKPLLCNNN